MVSHCNVVLLVQILHKNVAHPKLAAFVKKNSWLVESGEYLTFPQNQSEFKGGVLHYLESIEEVSFSCSKGLDYFN
jgi:tRNA wybutosine-synthesizing protein 1